MTGNNIFSGSRNPAANHSNMLLWILAIAAILRLSGLTAFSLSNDELSALARLQYDSVSTVITEGVYTDFHPAGVQLFLYYWTLIFGFSEWAVRLPFALMGIGSVYMLYKTGRLWFGEPAALLAAAALAVLEYPLLYSQLARPYSPGLFFSLVATYCWTRILFTTTVDGKWKKYLPYAGFVIAVSCCMYIHYFSFIFAGLLCIAGLFFLNRKTVVPYILSGACIVLLYLPHLNIFMHQLAKGGVGGADGWLGPPKDDAFGKYLDFCFNDSYQLKLLFLIITGGTVLLYRREMKLNRFHLLTLIFFLAPFAIAYYYSIYKNPVFQHSVLLFSFPYLLLLLFSFLPPDAGKFTVTLLLLCILAGGVYSTVSERNYYSTQHFTEFRNIAKRVKEIDESIGAENITKSISVFNPFYIQYYLDYYQHPGKFELTRVLSDDDKKKFRNLVEHARTPFYLHAFSNMYDDPQLDMIIRSRYPWLVARDSMLGSGLRLYSRTRTDSALNTLPVLTLDNGFEKGAWRNEIQFLDSTLAGEGKYSMHLPATVDFSPGIDTSLADLGISPGDVIEISALFYSENSPEGAWLVLSVENSETKFNYSSTAIGEFQGQPLTWFRAFAKCDVPSNTPPGARLKIYCWKEQKIPLYMDDFKMSVYSGRR